MLLLMCLLLCIVRLGSGQGNDVVTVMCKKRMQHIAELNYVGVLSVKRFLDIGANDGYWSKFASTLFPSAKFFLIEGNPYLFRTLEQTGNEFEISVVGSDAEKNTSVAFVVSAPSSGEGSGRLHLSQSSASSEEEILQELRHAQRRVSTIDDIMQQRNLQPFQFLRLNLQGRELDALLGATQTLQAAEFVLLEVPLHQYHPGAATFSDLDALLSQRGFRLYDVMDLRYGQPRADVDPLNQVPSLLQADVLWARVDSRVFLGAGFPPPPPRRFSEGELLASPPSSEQEQGYRAVRVTRFPGGLPADVHPEEAAAEPPLPTEASSTSPSVAKAWRRRKHTGREL